MATVFRAYEGFQGRPYDPLDRLPAAPPTTFGLSAERPPALALGLERDDGEFGSVRWASRDVLVALYAPHGGGLRTPVICVDVDGDGTFATPGEQRRVMCLTSDRGQRWRTELSVDGVPAVLEIERVPAHVRVARVSGGVRRPLALTAPPPQGVLAPDGARVELLARLRTAQREVLVGLRTLADGSASVGVDGDADGRLDTSAEWTAATPVAAAPGTRAWQIEGLAVAGERVTLRWDERAARTTATLSPPGALRGTVRWAGRTLALFLLDRDLDGAYTSHADLWWFGTLERLGRLHELTLDTMVEGDEPVFVAGVPWSLRIVEADGTAHVRPDPAAGTLPEYLARRHERVKRAWDARLAPEESAFLKANGVDPTRPRAAAPIPWQFAGDLDDALARAGVEGRPVFAFFEADWCPWCHRQDRVTFGDAEVVELLGRFVCVRLNYDFVSGGDYERHGGRGLPLMLFLDPEGRLLERPDKDPCDSCRGALLTSFEAPHVFVGRVRAALATWEALSHR